MSPTDKHSEIHSGEPDPLEDFHPGLPIAPSQDDLVFGTFPVDHSLALKERKTFLQVKDPRRSSWQTSQYLFPSHQETSSHWGDSTGSSVMPRSGMEGSLSEQTLDPAGAQSHTGSTRPQSSASGTSRALNSCKFLGMLRCSRSRMKGSELCGEHQAVLSRKEEELPACKQCPPGTATTRITSLEFQLCMICEADRHEKDQCLKCGKVDHQNFSRLDLGLCGTCRPGVGDRTAETQSSSSPSPSQ